MWFGTDQMTIGMLHFKGRETEVTISTGIPVQRLYLIWSLMKVGDDEMEKYLDGRSMAPDTRTTQRLL